MQPEKKSAPLSDLQLLRLLVPIYGGLTLVAQIILLREFLVLAQGREIHLGLGLCAWLLWTGLGSLLGGRLAGTSQPTARKLALLLLGLALLLPATILAARAWPTWTYEPQGGLPPAPRLLLTYLLLAGPFGLLSGLFFPFAGKVWAAASPAGALGRLYGWEAVGMSIGGLAATALLLAAVPCLTLAAGLLAGVSLLCLGLGLISRRGVGVMVGLALVLLLSSGLLDRWSRSWQLPGRQLLAAAETPYNLWQVTGENGQISLAANGLWCGTYPDPQTAEEQVHYALLQHPRPRRVLLLGGGVLGLLPEIFRHPEVTAVVYVEPDPGLLVLAQRVFPPEVTRFLGDPRVTLVLQDGRRFLARDEGRYEVILSAVPEPLTLGLNRYYTLEFFRLVRERLQPGGVFSFRLPASETGLQPERRRYLHLLAATLRQVFPVVVILPGQTWHYAASELAGQLTSEPAELAERLRARGLDLLYVREYYWQARLTPGRRAQAQELLATPAEALNTDLSPGAFYAALLLASLEEKSRLATLLQACRNLPLSYLFLLPLGLTLILWFQRLAGDRPLGLPLTVSALTLGFATLTAELVLLLVFQIALGYLFGQLGLMLVAFMGGLALGGIVGGRWVGRAANPRRLCRLSHGFLGLYLLLLGWSLPTLVHSAALRQEGWGQLTLALLLGLTGVWGGLIFAGLGEVGHREQGALARRAGWLYALDLAGATLGSLGAGLLLLPCYGPAPVLLLGGWLNLLAASLWLGPSRSA